MEFSNCCPFYVLAHLKGKQKHCMDKVHRQIQGCYNIENGALCDNI